MELVTYRNNPCIQIEGKSSLIHFITRFILLNSPFRKAQREKQVQYKDIFIISYNIKRKTRATLRYVINFTTVITMLPRDT